MREKRESKGTVRFPKTTRSLREANSKYISGMLTETKWSLKNKIDRAGVCINLEPTRIQQTAISTLNTNHIIPRSKVNSDP